MPDVKEVVNGLEMSYKYSNVDENNTLVPQWIVLHAIALLKEYERAIKHQSDHLDALLKAQEPVETTIGRAVEHDEHDSWWYQCGKCEKPIDWQDNYCRHCGMAVKWDG